MTATASPPHPTAPAHDDSQLFEAQLEPPAAEAVRNGHQNGNESSDSLSDLDDQFDDASEFDGINSAAVLANGHLHTSTGSAAEDPGLTGDEPPAKRQRLRDSTPPPRPRQKPVSPPWKKIEADGPTSFIENGRRKSGRTNLLSSETPPTGKKRLGKHVNGTPQSGSGHTAARPSLNGQASASKRHVSGTPKSASQKIAPTGKRIFTQPARPSPKASARRRPSPPPPPQRTPGTRRSARALRHDGGDTAADDDDDEESGVKPTKIKFRLKTTFIPLVHPLQANVLPGQTLPRPRVANNFADYIKSAPAVEIAAGGWLDPTDDVQQYTEEQIERDARMILRIEEETEPGGILSKERSALFVPDSVEEPPRQWAHMDHLAKQLANFRKLMVMEQQRHRSSAKRLAEACREEWLRRQPKSAEQVEAEARASWLARYRTVVRVVGATWENVRVEVNRRRLEEWQAAEQKRVKAALNEAVNMSEMRLQAHRAQADSESMDDSDSNSDDDEDEDGGNIDRSDEELEGDGNETNEDEETSDSDLESATAHVRPQALLDDDNMSSGDDDDDAKSTISDEGLTQDQLLAKYANVPDLPTVPSVDLEDGTRVGSKPRATSEDQCETSDESVDMDDDLGTSDDDMDSASDADSPMGDDESEEEEEDRGGLLGMLFGKSELKKLEKESGGAVDGQLGDEEMSEAPAIETESDKLLTNGHIPHQEEVHADTGGAGSMQNPIDASTLDSIDASETEEIAVDAPADPHKGNNPDAPATIPAPLRPENVEVEIKDAIEDVSHVERSGMDADGSTAEIAAASAETQNTSEEQAVSRVNLTEAELDTNQTEQSAQAIVGSRSMTPNTPQTQIPKTEVPFLLRGTLREYQHYGLDWLAGLYRNGTNGILADEMGLGKTIQTISLLAHLACHHEVWGPHLVIVPTSVMLNWEMEFKKWCPGFKVLSYYGSIEERKRKRQGWKDSDMWNVCITSYQIVLQDQQVFKRRRWHYMILDEAHNIKNFKSKRWQTLLGFNTQARLLLTGTPLQNNLTELWSLLFFLMPSENGVGGFADLAEFQDWFHKPESQILESGREQMDEEARAIIAKLHKVLRPYLLRRLKADVEKQMPAKYEHVEYCRLSRRQRELYDGFLARADTRDALSSGNYISVINCLMQLRKVCNHPDLFVERPIMTSFRQPRSVAAGYASYEQLVRKRISSDSMQQVNLKFLNLLPTASESLSYHALEDADRLSAHHKLAALQSSQWSRCHTTTGTLNPRSIKSSITYIEHKSRIDRLGELQQCIYVGGHKRQERPVYGKAMTDFLTLGFQSRPHKPRPKVPRQIMSWFEEDSSVLRDLIPTLDERAEAMRVTITKFACVTPAVVTRDIDLFVLGPSGVEAFTDMDLQLSKPIRYAPFKPKESPLDPWHEARMRLSIQFPDRRLLQYDCGKLQALDRLLRKLQAGGHRALIFTQMTKVLDILEQFLNIHGHKYLRLDGATKVEQRQILTDRFNNDNRILAFILSTRSGGLGINLTGADTVIFYDQDWNPAMDKQCQDRCHRIGQTRDVHIYRLISEHTIEGNILRKASQKQMLDDVVIQEGSFTTDYLSKLPGREVVTTRTHEEDVVGDAMDRVLGGVERSDQRTVNRVLEQAEDREDVDAARIAEKEIQEDEADFEEKLVTADASGASSTTQTGTPIQGDDSAAPGPGKSNLGLFSELADDVEDKNEAAPETETETERNAWGEPMKNIDDFLLATMSKMLEGTALELPRDKKKSKNKKGKDMRKR
ncbi:helicase SWR1 [Microdochium nivale]|nr:helicase SWR1 [Microdochium nivale]